MSKEQDIAAAQAALAAAEAEPDASWLDAEVRLDKSKPYAIRMPIDQVARYEQNGHLFDYAGELVKE